MLELNQWGGENRSVKFDILVVCALFQVFQVKKKKTVFLIDILSCLIQKFLFEKLKLRAIRE